MKTLPIKKITDAVKNAFKAEHDRVVTEFLVLKCKYRKLSLLTSENKTLEIVLDCKAADQFVIGDKVSVDIVNDQVTLTEAATTKSTSFALAVRTLPERKVVPIRDAQRPEGCSFNKRRTL